MYLRKIEIQGFKSFAHKVQMEFGPGITAIVGPNGSGKSNIADAVRWVMGEQSLKLLRSKKSEDVIFAGSNRKTRLGMAEVSLYLDNEDHQMPIDYSEVIITRRIYRNGEVEYLLNKNSVRLQDILLLLARSNIGQRTYSVIAQGTIDSFIMASATERKNLLDEAAGVRQFQMKKDQALLKLGHTQENLKQAEMLIQEIAPRLRSLTRQVKKLERREEVEAKLREAQVKYYGSLWQDISSQHDQTQKNYFSQEDERVRIEQELEEKQKELDQLGKQASRTEVFQNIQKSYQQVLHQKNSLLAEKALLEGQLELDLTTAGKQEVAWILREREEYQREEEEFSRSLQDIEDKIKNKKQILEEKLSVESQILSESEKIEQRLKIAKEKLEARTPLLLPEFQNELNQIYILQKDFIRRLTEVQEIKQLNRLKRKAERIEQRISSFLKKVKKSIPSIDPKEIFVLQGKLSHFLKQRDDLINEINDFKIEIKTLEEKKGFIKQSLNQLQERIEKIDRIYKRTAQTPEAAKGSIKNQKEEIENKIKDLDQRLREFQRQIDDFNQNEQEKREALLTLQKELRAKQDQLNEVSHKVNEIKVKLARLETKKEDLEQEYKEEVPEKFWSKITQFKAEEKPHTEELSNEILRLKHQLELIGGIDEAITREYQETKERYDFLTTQSKDLTEGINKLEKVIEELDQTIKKQFNHSFVHINREFGRYFKTLFKGGQAKLILQKEEVKEEPEDPGEPEKPEKLEKFKESKKPEKIITGIDIYACPPGKKLKNINMLSGGERALTSIALICAIISNNPSPFIVLDEVDAALDEANSIKFAAILKELAKKTQFIVITHNRATMENSKILYGVTMGDDGVSKLLSIRIEEAEKVIKQYGNR